MEPSPELSPAPLALVVQIGFAGSRRLWDSESPPADQRRFEALIEDWLVTRLKKLRQDLKLNKSHFFCGISALAIGADVIFSRACRTSSIPHRVFLPQTRDEFLNAQGTAGPDFPLQQQKDEVLQLLNSPHVIQERLVSNASQREQRFDDTNREIVRVSDVLICLVRENAVNRPGGTGELITRAVQRGKPVLVVQVRVAEGTPELSERWHLPLDEDGNETDPTLFFDPPKLPVTLSKAQQPSADGRSESLVAGYATAIKGIASPLAKRMHKDFKLKAIVIIGTHIIATVLASIVMAFHALPETYVLAILGAELLMLAIGVWTHRMLHRLRISHRWAEARLLAEVTRSTLAIGDLHVYLTHFFSLPFPRAIRPILRTINVLQLRSTRQDSSDWQGKRDRYIEQRLRVPRDGQILFYLRGVKDSARYLRLLHLAFWLLWGAAFLSTFFKFVLHHVINEHPTIKAILGTLAIVMPVLAAAALSLAAALDLEAQEQTYHELHQFLKRQERHLVNATSERDYAELVLETETSVLGETANWFSRRSFVTVA